MNDKEKKIQDDTNSNSPLGVKGHMKIKICGMKFPANIQNVVGLNPHFMGFIFYSKSPRYVKHLDKDTLDSIPKSIKKIGVFVNEEVKDILTQVYKYDLNGVQLHGSEMVQVCKDLRDAGLIVIKAFPISEAYNFRVTKAYEGVCDYFLFDTKTDVYGGSGLKFNWTILNEYQGNTPFLLSGGIAADDLKAILKIDHPQFAGVDLNSRFELSPGLKNLETLNGFLKKIRTPNH